MRDMSPLARNIMLMLISKGLSADEAGQFVSLLAAEVLLAVGEQDRPIMKAALIDSINGTYDIIIKGPSHKPTMPEMDKELEQRAASESVGGNTEEPKDKSFSA